MIGVRPPAAPSRDNPLQLSISQLSLANGLRVVLVNDPQATEVQVTMRYQVGAIDDPPAQDGTAHLVEHLMFDQVVDGESIARRLGRIATYFNATTTLDATTYVARAHPSRLADLLAIEAMRLRSRCEGISVAEFERERDVVLDEVRYRERAADVQVAVRAAVFGAEHPYSRRIAGTVETVSTITRERACAFVDAHYAVGKAVLVVSGNVPRARIDEALAGELSQVRPGAFSTVAAPTEPLFTTEAVTTSAPLQSHGLVLVWPLPADAKLRTTYRALVTAAAEIVSSEIRGSVVVIEPGGARANLIGLALAAGDGETDRELINGAAQALRVLPQIFERVGIRELDQLGFSRTRHGALYRVFALLDDARERDPMLAAYAAEGIDPSRELRARIQALHELTAREASSISRDKLAYDAAKVITVTPTQKQQGQRLSLTARLEEIDGHRPGGEMADARRPASASIAAPLDQIRTRRLANGLEVVLLPIASAPIVDVRLVFRAGTADEDPHERGVAMLAADALTFDERHLKDALAFVAAGGYARANVELDRTTFAVRGMSSQLDFLLAGLRRIVREGTFDDVDGYVRQVKRAKRSSNPAGDAFRAAVFGAEHPYAKAGLLRHADARLTETEAARFRAAHYTPNNATLVIAGQFDPATVDRWIDFLFADWRGGAGSRPAPPTSFTPAAFVTVDDSDRVALELVFPATPSDHAVRLVAAQMLSELTSSVRYQLGASYDASAELAEQRLSATYVVRMELDAGRAPAAAKLLAERVSRLHADPDFAARTFVAARQQVLTRLAAIGDSATRLASRVEHQVALGRDVHAMRRMGETVRELTIDHMTAALADLTLARAVIAMRGPAEIRDAFDAFGREPQRFAAPPRKPATETDEEEDDAYTSYADARPVANSRPPELVDPLTSPSSPFRVAFTLGAGASFAAMERDTGTARRSASYGGPSLTAAFGYRRRSSLRAGLQLGLSRFTGTTEGNEQLDFEFVSLDLGPFVQVRLHGPFWMGAVAGIRFEDDIKLHTGMAFGAQLGLDLVPVKRYGWLALFAGYEHARMPEARYGAFSVAAALRR